MRPVTVPKQHLVPTSEFSKICGISVRRLNVLIKQEGFPVAKTTTVSQNMIDCPIALKWLIDKEIKKLGLIPDVVGTDSPDILPGIKSEQFQKTKQERIKVETENKVRAGKLLDAEAVREAFSMANVLIKNILMGEAGRMSGGNATKRKTYKERFSSILDQYADSLESCFHNDESGEATETTPG